MQAKIPVLTELLKILIVCRQYKITDLEAAGFCITHSPDCTSLVEIGRGGRGILELYKETELDPDSKKLCDASTIISGNNTITFISRRDTEKYHPGVSLYDTKEELQCLEDGFDEDIIFQYSLVYEPNIILALRYEHAFENHLPPEMYMGIQHRLVDDYSLWVLENVAEQMNISLQEKLQ